MADNIFSRLGRLFQSNVIIRKTDDNLLIVKDLDFTQTSLTSNKPKDNPWEMDIRGEKEDLSWLLG